ncbi:uncharacterized protein A4U43_C03F12410 [Asparagus officinalis]|uniref:Uncharacterized protein n=1 Tax=Asparagus officinalis TaxID=4686 RepID=A0A5P1FA90_ASPOF|nr:uncharacterized GPI-anchored protein At1g61900-like [Asparagus officinalis]ONK75014.1 uncharacterized protein A4U43_C03F12410 [Asparagus officinalis]
MPSGPLPSSEGDHLSAAKMGEIALLPPNLSPFVFFLLFAALQDLCTLDKFAVYGSPVVHQRDSIVTKETDNTLLSEISPNSAPQPLIPLLAPSPLVPFQNNSTPELSGKCILNLSATDSLMRITAVDCWASVAPFLANVICCPQLRATINILVGQSSKETGMLALDATHANYCLSDVQEILGSQGANYNLQKICLIRPSNLSEGSCPVKDTNEFESIVDSSQLLAACKKVDAVNECCSQICQNAILEAATKISLRDGGLPSSLSEHSSMMDDCRNVVLRWLSSRIDPLSANQVLRRISNCKVNEVCPLVFPDTKVVAEECGSVTRNHMACCNSMSNYVSHLQKQSFITNLQALDCATQLGLKLQKMNVTTDIFNFCHITLKDFSLQVGSQESGCLLPSLPSDATFDPSTGISFTCDLNDNIAAPWPSASLVPSSSCNKTVKMPALPAATSAQIGHGGREVKLQQLIIMLLAFMIFFI